MKTKLDEELKKIDQFMDQILAVANEDGQISKDEQSILDEIMREIGDYRQLVFDVMEDNILTEQEKVKMRAFKERLINLVNSKALRDGIITEEEEKLIDSLFIFVSSG